MNKDKQIKDLTNIVKYFVNKCGGEIVIGYGEIDKMNELELCEFHSLTEYKRIFKTIGKFDYYKNKFNE